MDGTGKRSSGGNVQRESFRPVKAQPEGPRGKPDNQGEGTGDTTTTITHHGDGTHSVQHSDGESTERQPIGHVAMQLHSKHSDGEGMHIGKDDAGVTTHHVGMDGQVEGPNQHESVDAAAEHMKSCIGEDGGNGTDMAMHENPDTQDYLG